MLDDSDSELDYACGCKSQLRLMGHRVKLRGMGLGGWGEGCPRPQDSIVGSRGSPFQSGSVTFQNLSQSLAHGGHLDGWMVDPGQVSCLICKMKGTR